MNITPGMKLEELDTPALLVDIDRMERNIQAWQTDISSHLESMSEEQGVVKLGDSLELNVDDRLMFYPIHVCTTVNQSDELIGIRNGRVEKVC